ncbi:MAG TPA: ATP-binding protein [Candidatus Limnocylindrales bacterium]|nr:ATP-binding protein [Candidatus Limnocylindrales bacterium]
MATRATPSPLAGAVLALIGPGVTAPELVTRLAEHEATVDVPIAKARLDELCEVGLTRAVVTDDETRYYVTPLGERLLRMSFTADPDQVDLLAEIEQMRTDLLSTIAHELRTPLTAVRTSVGLLLDPSIEPDPDERRTLLTTIDRNAMRMQRLVGDILDLSRFRAGRVQLQLRRFDAREVASSAISSVVPLAEAQGQTITLVAPDESVPVFGDHQRLEQALVNLLSNAGKYSPAGKPITVTVSAADDRVSWSVADKGHGIRPEDKARLFERFFVAGRDRREATAGTGLGLPITQLIVEAHGGRIDVRSQVGRGSTFTITVPAQGPEEAPIG